MASYEERQAKAKPYHSDEQCESMLQLVLPLGFAVIFGPSAPLAVVLCLFLFAINIRATGTLLLLSMRRSFPFRATGIGAWKDCIELLMKIGVIANGFFLVQYGITFRNTPVLTKCTGIFLFVAVSMLMCRLVDVLIPEHADEVTQLVKRREHVLLKISHIHDTRKSRNKLRKEAEAAHPSDKGSETAPSEASKFSPRPGTPISPREDSREDSRLGSREDSRVNSLHSGSSMHAAEQPRMSSRTATGIPVASAANVTAVLDKRWQEIGLFPGAKVATSPSRQTSSASDTRVYSGLPV